MFREAAFEWYCLPDEFYMARVVCGANRIVSRKSFQNHLVLAWPIENDGGAVAPGPGDFKHARGRIARQQMPQVSLPILRPNDRAVADDHRERRANLKSDGHGEVVPPARD